MLIFVGRPALLEEKINPDWVPSQNMGYLSTTLASPSSVNRMERLSKRKLEQKVCT